MNDVAAPANSPRRPPHDRFAAGLRGFGPLGTLAILVIVAGQIIAPLSAVLVLAWAKLSRTPWSEIGYARPRSWIGSLLVGITVGVALKLLLKMIVMPLLGAAPINQAYHATDPARYAMRCRPRPNCGRPSENKTRPSWRWTWYVNRRPST
jgi:hypothetical protein